MLYFIYWPWSGQIIEFGMHFSNLTCKDSPLVFWEWQYPRTQETKYLAPCLQEHSHFIYNCSLNLEVLQKETHHSNRKKANFEHSSCNRYQVVGGVRGYHSILKYRSKTSFAFVFIWELGSFYNEFSDSLNHFSAYKLLWFPLGGYIKTLRSNDGHFQLVVAIFVEVETSHCTYQKQEIIF